MVIILLFEEKFKSVLSSYLTILKIFFEAKNDILHNDRRIEDENTF